MSRLLLGTRRSKLAWNQAGMLADDLRDLGHDVEMVPVISEGDRDQQTPLRHLGGTGVFVSALREALLSGAIDIAVHSLKDLPTAPQPGLVIAAHPRREDPRDALVARDGLTLGELPAGAVIGTGSPRRRAQLLNLGLGHVVADLRGNVDTRLASVARGGNDAVVLALAGLRRVGRAGLVTEVLDPIQVLPAPGQGCLAVEIRADDARTHAAVAPLDDADTRACVTAERALLATLEAGCSAPVGALAEVVMGEDGDELSLRGVVAAVDGSGEVRRALTGPIEDPVGLGARLAHLLLEDGAADLIPDLTRLKTATERDL